MQHFRRITVCVPHHSEESWQGGVEFFQKRPITCAAVHDVVAEAALKEALRLANDPKQPRQPLKLGGLQRQLAFRDNPRWQMPLKRFEKIIGSHLSEFQKDILARLAIAGEVIHRVVERLWGNAELGEHFEIRRREDLRWLTAPSAIDRSGTVIEFVQFVIHFEIG